MYTHYTAAVGSIRMAAHDDDDDDVGWRRWNEYIKASSPS